MKSFSCTELPIEYEDIRGLDRLRSLHRDPFDRLLISQASRRRVTLATLDQKIVHTFEVSGQFSIFTDRARNSLQKDLK